MKKQTHSDLQLWLMLASIPVLAVVAVYVYGALAFDDNAIVEIDTSLTSEEQNQRASADALDLDREFTAPLDVPQANRGMTTTSRPSMVPDLASTPKEQSLSQMLSKKNENLRLGSNGHPMLVRVQENDNLESLSARYLGSPAFWPYIFLVNNEKLSSPNAIKAGMTLYLPDSTFYDMNLQDTLALKKAESLGKSVVNTAK